MLSGNVYWLKGTNIDTVNEIGIALYYELRKQRDNVVILENDLSQILNTHNTIDESAVSRLSKMLSDQGLVVVVCSGTVSEDILNINREAIIGYIEISTDTEDINDVLGDRNSFCYNKNAPLRSIVREIISLAPQRTDDYDRDKGYWNSYYRNLSDKIPPSDFAVFAEKRFGKNVRILELGCGNGRDSLYFLSKGHSVVAVDGSDAAIDALNNLTSDNSNALFVCDDFVKCRPVYLLGYDFVYSRFTLHAITEIQENELLSNIKSGLKPNGFFCVEARTIHDDIYGLGEEVAHNSYIYNNHFRRFIDVEDFKTKLISMGFEILYLEEGKGFSKTKDSDPCLMRCIAKLEL